MFICTYIFTAVHQKNMDKKCLFCSMYLILKASADPNVKCETVLREVPDVLEKDVLFTSAS